jgi:hypothetical protein
MSELNPHSSKSTLPPTILPVIGKLKDAYKLWQSYFVHLPKISKYSLGEKIDRLLVETLEAAITASFLGRHEKLPYVRISIRKLDTTKIFLLIAWEVKAIDDSKFITLSEVLNESGKMLGGWHGQLVKSLDGARDKQNPTLSRS